MNNENCENTTRLSMLLHNSSSSAQRQKGLTGNCFKYIDRPFCLQTDILDWKGADHTQMERKKFKCVDL